MTLQKVLSPKNQCILHSSIYLHQYPCSFKSGRGQDRKAQPVTKVSFCDRLSEPVRKREEQ